MRGIYRRTLLALLSLLTLATSASAECTWVLWLRTPDGILNILSAGPTHQECAAVLEKLRPGAAPGESLTCLPDTTRVGRRGSEGPALDASAEISRVSELSLDLERPSDRERYDALLQPERELPIEYCKLLEYRQDAANCWRPGLGLR